MLEQRLQGASDSALFEVCRDERRALVTLDLGFADIRSYPPAEHSGVIVLRPPNQDLPALRALLAQVVRLLERHAIDRRLWIVEEGQVRQRR